MRKSSLTSFIDRAFASSGIPIQAAEVYNPKGYEKDTGFPKVIDGTWKVRVQFAPVESPSSLYVLYTKNVVDQSAALPSNRSRDYNVLVYYTDRKDFDKKAFDKSSVIARFKTLPLTPGTATLTTAPGNLMANTWAEIEGKWIPAQKHTIDQFSVIDWNDPEQSADGKRLKHYVEEVIDNPDDQSPEQVIELANDLGSGRIKTFNDALIFFQQLYGNTDTDWASLEVKGVRAGWTFHGSGSDGAPPTESGMSAPVESLSSRAEELLDILNSRLNTAPKSVSESVLSRSPDYDDISIADEDTLRGYINQLNELITEFTNQAPVDDSDGEDVQALPPGTRLEVPTAPAPWDTRVTQPEADPRITTVDSINAPLSTADELKSALAGIVQSYRSSNGLTEISLKNDIEVTLTKAGARYAIDMDTWIDDSEKEQLLNLLGTSTNASGALLSGEWKGFIRIKKQAENWDVVFESPVPLNRAVDFIRLLARINTSADSIVAPPPNDEGFNLLDGITFHDPTDNESIDDTSPDFGDETLYYTAGEWSSALVEAGLERKSTFRYQGVSSDNQAIQVRLINVDLEIADSEFKKAELRVGNGKPTVYNSPDEIIAELDDLMASIDKTPEDDEIPDMDEVEDEDGEVQDSRIILMDSAYVLKWDGIPLIAIDGDEDTAPWLKSHDFVWHPDLYMLSYSSKSKALQVLDMLQANGVIVSNLDEVRRVVNGQKLERKPFQEILKVQLAERKKPTEDMNFSLHVALDAEGSPFFVATKRVNNRKADTAFRRCKFTTDSRGYWLPVRDKSECFRALTKLHKEGLRFTNAEVLENTWSANFDTDLKLDFNGVEVELETPPTATKRK